MYKDHIFSIIIFILKPIACVYFSFELSVDMLDYMDDILTLQAQGDCRILYFATWKKIEYPLNFHMVVL